MVYLCICVSINSDFFLPYTVVTDYYVDKLDTVYRAVRTGLLNMIQINVRHLSLILIYIVNCNWVDTPWQ